MTSTQSPEVWKPVPGYVGRYEISNRGRVKSVRRTCRAVLMGRPILRTVPEKILTPLAHPVDGHLRVRLFSGDGIATSVRRQVHHLVLCAFVCERPSGMVGCHNDDNPANNTLENLRWDTPAANVADAIRSGNHASARWIREKQKRTEARRRASA